MDNIHGLEKFFVLSFVSQGKVKACIRERETRVSDDAGFIVLMIEISESEHINFVPGGFKRSLVQVDVIRHAADIGLVGVSHHSNFHGSIVNLGAVCCQDAYGRMTRIGDNLVKLVLRGKEYEVKPGMTLLDSLKKINVLSESVIATRDGEMILDDEILKDGQVVKLIAVISGGTLE